MYFYLRIQFGASMYLILCGLRFASSCIVIKIHIVVTGRSAITNANERCQEETTRAADSDYSFQGNTNPPSDMVDQDGAEGPKKVPTVPQEVSPGQKTVEVFEKQMQAQDCPVATTPMTTENSTVRFDNFNGCQCYDGLHTEIPRQQTVFKTFWIILIWRNVATRDK